MNKYKVSKKLRNFANRFAPKGQSFTISEGEELPPHLVKLLEHSNILCDKTRVLGQATGGWEIWIKNNTEKSHEYMDLVFLHELGHCVLNYQLMHRDDDRKKNEKLVSTWAVTMVRGLGLTIPLSFLKHEGIEEFWLKDFGKGVE